MILFTDIYMFLLISPSMTNCNIFVTYCEIHTDLMSLVIEIKHRTCSWKLTLIPCKCSTYYVALICTLRNNTLLKVNKKFSVIVKYTECTRRNQIHVMLRLHRSHTMFTIYNHHSDCLLIHLSECFLLVFYQ